MLPTPEPAMGWVLRESGGLGVTHPGAVLLVCDLVGCAGCW